MNTDLLERMKRDISNVSCSMLSNSLAKEAIAEIERLQQLNQQLRDAIQTSIYTVAKLGQEKQKLQNLYDHLRAEYAELTQNR